MTDEEAKQLLTLLQRYVLECGTEAYSWTVGEVITDLEEST